MSRSIKVTGVLPDHELGYRVNIRKMEDDPVPNSIIPEQWSAEHLADVLVNDPIVIEVTGLPANANPGDVVTIEKTDGVDEQWVVHFDPNEVDGGRRSRRRGGSKKQKKHRGGSKKQKKRGGSKKQKKRGGSKKRS